VKKLIEKILSGSSDANIKFSDLRKLILYFGFNERIKGDHYIYYKENIKKLLICSHKKMANRNLIK